MIQLQHSTCTGFDKVKCILVNTWSLCILVINIPFVLKFTSNNNVSTLYLIEIGAQLQRDPCPISTNYNEPRNTFSICSKCSNCNTVPSITSVDSCWIVLTLYPGKSGTNGMVQQEFIPVGCVPPTAVAVGGCLHQAPPRADPPGTRHPQHPPIDRILDMRFWKYYLAPNFVCGR